MEVELHAPRCLPIKPRVDQRAGGCSRTAPTPMKDPDSALCGGANCKRLPKSASTFCREPYDREADQAIHASSLPAYSRARTDMTVEWIEALFAGETGMRPPKVDVRAAAFDNDDRILMVREISDGGRWTSPGGWADVNLNRSAKCRQGSARGERL